MLRPALIALLLIACKPAPPKTLPDPMTPFNLLTVRITIDQLSIGLKKSDKTVIQDCTRKHGRRTRKQFLCAQQYLVAVEGWRQILAPRIISHLNGLVVEIARNVPGWPERVRQFICGMHLVALVLKPYLGVRYWQIMSPMRGLKVRCRKALPRRPVPQTPKVHS